MDRVTKALQKLSRKEREAFKIILEHIVARNLAGFDIKKLKGHEHIYRARKGNLRVIYRVAPNNTTMILAIERRSDTTYRDF